MRVTMGSVFLAALLALGTAETTATAAPTPREVLGSELLVKEYLERLDVPPGHIQPLHDDLLSRAFPDYLFFVAVYPAAAAANLPEPLKHANVFAVDPNGVVKLLTGSPDVVELFKAGFRLPKGQDRCLDAVRVLLVLWRARYPEYKLSVVEDQLQINADGKRGKLGIGKLVATEGGTGGIELTLTLDPQCRLLKVVDVITLKQVKIAVKRPTPAIIERDEKVVRTYIVEAKLPVEQVKHFEDPLLLRVLPGYVFFVVPTADPDGKEGDPKVVRRNVVMVDPDGKLQPVLGKNINYGVWFHKVFGPATSDPRIKEGLAIAVKLNEIVRPDFKFDPPGDPEFSTDENGNRMVLNKVYAIAPSGRKWVLTVRLLFGKRGRLAAWWWGLTPA